MKRLTPQAEQLMRDQLSLWLEDHEGNNAAWAREQLILLNEITELRKDMNLTIRNDEKQETRCLRGEHEAQTLEMESILTVFKMTPIVGTDTRIMVCKHCRCLYVEK